MIEIKEMEIIKLVPYDEWTEEEKKEFDKKRQNKRNFYYTVEPIMKHVTKQEFIDFINHYPRELVRDVYGVYEPPLVTYNDFELADRWHYSVVAKTFLYDDNPGDYFYEPEEERKYCIMENYEEVFNSRTGNKTED